MCKTGNSNQTSNPLHKDTKAFLTDYDRQSLVLNKQNFSGKYPMFVLYLLMIQNTILKQIISLMIFSSISYHHILHVYEHYRLIEETIDQVMMQ